MGADSLTMLTPWLPVTAKETRMDARMRVIQNIVMVAVAALLVAVAGCDRGKTPAGAPAASAKRPTVASLVPAATDLLVGMGARAHLVAVSNYDQGSVAADLPKVGDYQTIDWEKLSQIRPDVIVTQYGPGRTPGGFVERVRELHIRQVNVKLDGLEDIYKAIDVLGEASAETQPATAESGRIRDGLEAVRRRVRDQPPVRAIIVIGSAGSDLVGRNTYLDDLLTQAEGVNAVRATGYVTLDREAIAALRPQAVLVLLPDKDAQAAAAARASWDSYMDMPAVRDHRVWTFTESYITQPGSHVADVAEKFAEALHPAGRGAGTASGPGYQPGNEGSALQSGVPSVAKPTPVAEAVCGARSTCATTVGAAP